MPPESFDCPSPVHPRPGDSLEAPAAAGQGVGAPGKYPVRRSVGLLSKHFSDLSAIASEEGRSVESVMRSLIVLGLLSRHQERRAEQPAGAAHEKRSAGAAPAGLSIVPDGNHGDNRTNP